MKTDLEVVWNGSHEHADHDLLCCPAIGEKRAPEPEPAAVRSLRSTPGHTSSLRGDPRYAAVRACLEQHPATAWELHVATGFSQADVRAAIIRLQRQRRIRASWIPVRERTKATVWTRYYWKAA